MAVANHTFSFRAPTELAPRMRESRTHYAELSADPDTAAHIARELQVRLLRSLRDPSERVAQGTFMRAVVEAFVDSVERTMEGRAVSPELSAFDRDDRAGASEREKLLEESSAALDR